METFANIESFVRSAESGSFSKAARTLGLTPAAVSRNVAKLEANLAVRLFQRSTRKLVLTEAGQRLLVELSGGLDTIQAALANVSAASGKPAGVLKVSLAFAFGLDHVLPIVSEFARKYPDVVPDLHFDNRSVDLIAEGFDVAIGGGIDLTPGVVAREIARVQAIVVASPDYMAQRKTPGKVSDLGTLDGISRRSPQSGRVRAWMLRNASGDEAPVDMKTRAIMSDPEAMCRAATLGMGVAIVPHVHALPYLERGALIRLLPKWHADIGVNYLYYASSRLMPAKTRAFVDFFLQRFRDTGLKRRFAAETSRSRPASAPR